MSSITVVTPPPATDLTTVDKVKLTFGITGTDHDVLIGDMIKAASDFAVRYTGRQFAKQTVKESLPSKGVGQFELILSLTPIVGELELVEFDTEEISDVVILDAEAGFIQRRGGFRTTALGHPSLDFHPSSSAEYRWHVTYTGGYVLPGWDEEDHGSRTLPYDLERAIIEMVKSQFSSRKFDGTMKSYKIGDTAITWDRALSSDASGAASIIPASALGVLNYYRRAY